MVVTLDQILVQSAEKFKALTAYRFEGKGTTYGEANRMCSQLASLLKTLGISKGDRVGICLHRCVESFIAVHAILRIGAVFVPIDTKFPAKRIAGIASDAEIKVIISSQQQAALMNSALALLPGLKIVGYAVDEQDFSWDNIFRRADTEIVADNILDSDLAYIIYSSGSTGTPKGIVHTHASGLSYAREAAKLYGLTEKDVVVSHSTLSYDISTFAYFASPLAGACTLVLSDTVCMVPASLSLLLETEQATVWYSVPLALKQLLNLGALDSRNLNQLRWVLYGGEPIPVDDIRQLIRLLPQAMFSNVYGPAEVNQCTFNNFNAIGLDAKEIPLGRVWDAASYFIIDDDNEIIAGIPRTGELVIKSTTMMKGYWKSAKPQTEVFFSSQETGGRKFYRTGDIVHENGDGILYFVGRKDRQVKIHGYRVELKEIEHLLEELDYLSDVAVIADKKSRANDYIAVFAVKADGHEGVPAAEIRKYLKQVLPAYAVPEHIMYIDEMPYAPSGKKDFAKLENYLLEINEREITNVHSR